MNHAIAVVILYAVSGIFGFTLGWGAASIYSELKWHFRSRRRPRPTGEVYTPRDDQDVPF